MPTLSVCVNEKNKLLKIPWKDTEMIRPTDLSFFSVCVCLRCAPQIPSGRIAKGCCIFWPREPDRSRPQHTARCITNAQCSGAEAGSTEAVTEKCSTSSSSMDTNSSSLLWIWLQVLYAARVDWSHASSCNVSCLQIYLPRPRIKTTYVSLLWSQNSLKFNEI